MGHCCVLSNQHHCTCVLLNTFSNLDSTFANELAVGNTNIKTWEKVNSFSEVANSFNFSLSDTSMEFGWNILNCLLFHSS